jgi:hypothetical protein
LQNLYALRAVNRKAHHAYDAPIDLVEKAVKSFQNEVRRKKDQEPQFPERVVAISRHLGSSGKRVAELLKKWLEWPVWDKELLGVLADPILIAAAHKCGLKIDLKEILSEAHVL